MQQQMHNFRGHKVGFLHENVKNTISTDSDLAHSVREKVYNLQTNFTNKIDYKPVDRIVKLYIFLVSTHEDSRNRRGVTKNVANPLNTSNHANEPNYTNNTMTPTIGENSTSSRVPTRQIKNTRDHHCCCNTNRAFQKIESVDT